MNGNVSTCAVAPLNTLTTFAQDAEVGVFTLNPPPTCFISPPPEKLNHRQHMSAV